MYSTLKHSESNKRVYETERWQNSKIWELKPGEIRSRCSEAFTFICDISKPKAFDIQRLCQL